MEGVKTWHSEHRFRVRYAETDNMGIAYHANYLVWFEMGRTELMREHGLSYHDVEARGVLLPVIKAELNYRQSALYDDILIITTTMSRYGRVSVQLDYQLHRENDGTLLADGLTRHCFIRTTNHNLVRIPEFFLEHYQWTRHGSSAD